YGDETQNFGPNWAVLILPFVEQDNLFNSQKASIWSYMTSGNNAWRSVRGMSLKVYLCPADAGGNPFSGAGGGWARGNYAANAGPPYVSAQVGGVLRDTAGGQSPSNSLPVYQAGTSNPALTLPYPAGGVLCVNYGVSLPELTSQDGTSSTILFNEVRIGPA